MNKGSKKVVKKRGDKVMTGIHKISNQINFVNKETRNLLRKRAVFKGGQKVKTFVTVFTK